MLPKYKGSFHQAQESYKESHLTSPMSRVNLALIYRPKSQNSSLKIANLFNS